MKLKKEDTSNAFTFLEGIIKIMHKTNCADTIDIKYNNKNYTNLKENGYLKYLTLQHRHSFITPLQAVSKLVGQFCRMERTTNKPVNLITATFQFILIAKYLKYPDQEIKKALFKMCQKNTYTGIWQKIYDLFSVSSGKYGDLFAQFALKNYSQTPSDILPHLPLHRHHPSSCTCRWD